MSSCDLLTFILYCKFHGAKVSLHKVAGSIPAGAIGIFIDIKSLRSHYGCGVDRNEHQEHFLGVKAAGA